MEESMYEKPNSQTLVDTWKRRLEEWSSSGKSLAEWCRDQRLNYHRLIYWKGRLMGKAKKKKQNTRTPIGFVEINEDSSTRSGVVIEYDHLRIHLLPGFHEGTFLL